MRWGVVIVLMTVAFVQSQEYLNVKIRGVNLGSWLLLEKWYGFQNSNNKSVMINRMIPTLYKAVNNREDFMNGPCVDEWTFSELWVGNNPERK
jgi:hypothetical protein